MSIAASANLDFVPVETRQQFTAARRIIEEAADALEHRVAVDHVCALWAEAFDDFRAFEKEWFVYRRATDDELNGHRDLVNLFILASATLISAAERQLAIYDFFDQDGREAIKERLELVRRHRQTLEFDFTCWHGRPFTPEQLAIAKRKLCVDV